MSIDTTEATPDEDASAIPVVDVSPSALKKVIGIRDEEDEPETLGLRIEVTGTKGTEYTYDLAFEVLAEAEEGDDLTDIGGLTVWVPADSIDALRGSVLDLPSAAGQVGLVIRNPNRADPLAAAKDLVLTGTVAEQVQQLLDESINPSLASHGGYATLVGVDGSTAYVVLERQQTRVAWPVYDVDDIEEEGAGGAVKAPINGKVARIFVAEGQTVAKGDRIAVVEAMKMEHVLHAARDGIVGKVAAAEGAQVNQGALIASLAEEA